VLLVMNVLKVLEQEDHLQFNENIFLPAQVKFTTPKELLIDFEQTHPMLEPVIKCLLRTYQGIADNRVSVHEKQVAKLAGLSYDSVKHDLQQLNALGVIEYLPQKETPQIHFLTNRAPAQFLTINHENYLHRKQQYELRVEAMLRYIHLKKDCRSEYISAYFGDNKIKECGICDICLQKKNTALTQEEFKKIQERIYKYIPHKGIATKELLHHLNGIKKDKVWVVLNFLQSEKKIAINTLGIIKQMH